MRDSVISKIERADKILGKMDEGVPSYTDLSNYCLELARDVVSLSRELNEQT